MKTQSDSIAAEVEARFRDYFAEADRVVRVATLHRALAEARLGEAFERCATVEAGLQGALAEMEEWLQS